MKKPGFVFLVGAGPGRPELITLRGVQCLAKADAVVLDALASRRLLDHCRPGAAVFEAGKRGRGRVLMRQPAINRLLLRLARAGKTVVRLKGGDPYFFGRGGEEAEFLRDHGVPFEVVPGVSSVMAAPAYAGIPLTHRGLTSTVTVVTGHAGRENPYLKESARDARRRGAPGVDWDKLDPRNTLVVLMGLARLPDIVARLRRAGWPKSTPAAVTQWGTLGAQRTVAGTLEDIARRVKAARLGAPAVIVLGSVVKLRPSLNWFERLPLFGRTVLVTRAQGQASSLAGLLEAQGAQVLEGPAIRIEPLPLGSAGRRFLKTLDAYDGVLFTSANAARHFARHLRGPWPAGPSVYAVGPKTAETLAGAGLPVHGVAREFRAEGLADLLTGARGKRFLFPRALEGRETLAELLRARGARVDLWPVYRTAREKLDPSIKEALLRGRVDCVVFASASAADSLLGQLSPARRRRVFRKTRAASIGPVTSAALRARGVRPRVEPRRSTIEDLAAAVAGSFRR